MLGPAELRLRNEFQVVIVELAILLIRDVASVGERAGAVQNRRRHRSESSLEPCVDRNPFLAPKLFAPDTFILGTKLHGQSSAMVQRQLCQ